MRGLLDGQWHEIEPDDGQAKFWTGAEHYSLVDDPEYPLIDERDFDAIEESQ